MEEKIKQLQADCEAEINGAATESELYNAVSYTHLTLPTIQSV